MLRAWQITRCSASSCAIRPSTTANPTTWMLSTLGVRLSRRVSICAQLRNNLISLGLKYEGVGSRWPLAIYVSRKSLMVDEVNLRQCRKLAMEWSALTVLEMLELLRSQILTWQCGLQETRGGRLLEDCLASINARISLRCRLVCEHAGTYCVLPLPLASLCLSRLPNMLVQLLPRLTVLRLIDYISNTPHTSIQCASALAELRKNSTK